MSNIADKLATIAGNVKKVYEAGYAVGHRDSDEMGGYTAGYNAGKQAERDTFWDAYIPDGLTNWQYMFYSPRWNDDNFYPNKDIRPIGNFTFGLSSHSISNIKQRLDDCGVTLDTSGVTSGNYMVAFCSGRLTHLPTISLVGLTENISNTFNNDRQLIEIEKIILKDDGSTTFVNWFTGCISLTEIRFDGVIGQDISFNDCLKLSANSIGSIADHLSATTSGKTLTLSKAAVDEAFKLYNGPTLDEDPNGYDDPNNWFIGSEAGAWIEICATHPNWTITLI